MALKRSAVRSRLGPHKAGIWDRSSAWLERRPVKAEVAGSSPVGPAHVPEQRPPFGGRFFCQSSTWFPAFTGMMVDTSRHPPEPLNASSSSAKKMLNDVIEP
ncbi:MAG: hypothetical protein RIR53_1834 [Bacteroidota bacterium]